VKGRGGNSQLNFRPKQRCARMNNCIQQCQQSASFGLNVGGLWISGTVDSCVDLGSEVSSSGGGCFFYN
jgi:hypothetical protein